jgi:acetyltransferase-like isoleucine patch superfamily enzyme
MVASDVQFMTSDAHSVIDADTGRRINPAADIFVGDHVWLGLQTVILKGASIGAGAVVGLRAVVTGSVPANCVAAGTPARVIRQNVRWDRKLVQDADGPIG